MNAPLWLWLLYGVACCGVGVLAHAWVVKPRRTHLEATLDGHTAPVIGVRRFEDSMKALGKAAGHP